MSSRGHGGRHGGPQGPQPTLDKPKREAILDLAKYANARIRVKFTGGREGTCFFFLFFILFSLIERTNEMNE
jgi:U6 snRNA-associated Sm-like protein LSm7